MCQGRFLIQLRQVYYQLMADDHQTDYSQITEEIFIGSDLCKGLWCPIHSEVFVKLGIAAEINLEIERDETPTPGVDAYLWLPTPDNQAPSMNQLMLGSAAICEMVRINKKVYVHCKMGHGRSPTVVAAYLIRYEQMGVEKAIETIKIKRPEIHLEEVQKQALAAFEKECKSYQLY